MKLLLSFIVPILLVTAIGLTSWPLTINAQLDQGRQIGEQAANEAKLPASGNAKEIILKIINFVLGLVGLLAVLFLIIAGVMYITSLGDEGKAEKAKKMILYIIIGILLVLFAAVIVNTVLTKFLGGGPAAGQ